MFGLAAGEAILRGMERKTRQRDAVCGVFERESRPLSPLEVLQEAQRELPTLGIATVYRHLRSLVEEEWLQLVELPGVPPRYERAGKHHHHHFHCHGCGKVYELEGCTGGFASLVPDGFELESHTMVLHGRCAGCTHAA